MICAKDKSEKGSTSAAASVSEGDASAAIVCGVSDTVEKREKDLPTGYIEVQSENGNSNIVRVMLDTGSQKTSITEALADRLGAGRVGEDKFYLQSAGYANSKKCSGDVVEITLKRRFSKNSLKIRATALSDVIKGTLPNLNYKGKLKPIADNNNEGWSTQVGILIGVYFLTNIVSSIMKKSNGLIAFETIFGYFLCGVPQGEDIQFE